MPSTGGHAIAFGGDANDKISIVMGHKRDAIAAGSCAIKSSATKAAPARLAAS
jgi:hypothetical protein